MASTIVNSGYYIKQLRDAVDQIYIESVDCLPCFSGAPQLKCHHSSALNDGCASNSYVDYAFVSNYYYKTVYSSPDCIPSSQYFCCKEVPLGQRHEIDQTDLSGYIAGTPSVEPFPALCQSYFEDAFQAWGNLINGVYRYCGYENSLQVDFINKGDDIYVEPQYHAAENTVYPYDPSCIINQSILLAPEYTPLPVLSMDPVQSSECGLLSPIVRIAMVKGLSTGEFASGVAGSQLHQGMKNYDENGDLVYGVCNFPKPELEGNRGSHSSIVLNQEVWGHDGGAFGSELHHNLRKIAMQLVGNALGFKAANPDEHSIMSPNYVTVSGAVDSDPFAADFPRGLDKDVDGKAFLELYGECRSVPGEMEQIPPSANCKSKWHFTNMAPCNSESYNWLASRINAVSKIKPYKINDYEPFKGRIAEFAGKGSANEFGGGKSNTFGSDGYVPRWNTPLIPKDCYSWGDGYDTIPSTESTWDVSWLNETRPQSSVGAVNDHKRLLQALGVPIYGANDLPSIDGVGSSITGDLYSGVLTKDYNSIDIESRVYDVKVEPIRNEASPYLANLGYLNSPWPGLLREVAGSFSFAPCGVAKSRHEHLGFVRTKLESLFTQETRFELKSGVREIVDPWAYDKPPNLGQRWLDKTSMLAYLPDAGTGTALVTSIGDGEGNDYSYKWVWHDKFCGATDLSVAAGLGWTASVDYEYKQEGQSNRCGGEGIDPCCGWRPGETAHGRLAGSLTKKELLIQNNLYGDPVGEATGFWWAKTSEVRAAIEATGFYFEFKRVSIPYKLQGFDISYATEPACYVRESGDIHDLTGYVSYSVNLDGTMGEMRTNRVQPEQSFQDYIETGVSIGGLLSAGGTFVGNPIQPLRRNLQNESNWNTWTVNDDPLRPFSDSVGHGGPAGPKGTMTYTWIETNNSYNDDIRAGRWFNNFNTILWTPEIDPLDEGFLYFNENGVISTTGAGVTDPVFEFETTGYFPFLNRIETFVYADSEEETTWVLPLDPNYHSYVNRQPDISNMKMYKTDFVKTQSVTNGRKLMTKSDTTGVEFFSAGNPVDYDGTGFNLILNIESAYLPGQGASYKYGPSFFHADGHVGPCTDVISSSTDSSQSNFLFQRSVRGIDEGVMYYPEAPPWPAGAGTNHLKLKWLNMLYAYDSQPVFETTVGDKYKEIFLASRLNLFPKDLYIECSQSEPAAGLSASRNNKSYIISHYESDLKYFPYGIGTGDFHPAYIGEYNSASADGSIISHLDMSIMSLDPWYNYVISPLDFHTPFPCGAASCSDSLRRRWAPSQLLSMNAGLFLPDHGSSGPTDAGFWEAPGTNIDPEWNTKWGAATKPLRPGWAGYGRAFNSRSMVESPLTPSVDTNYFPKAEVSISGYQVQNILVGTANSFYLEGTSFLGGGQKAAINIHWDDFVDI
jgi:hypothetical protein